MQTLKKLPSFKNSINSLNTIGRKRPFGVVHAYVGQKHVKSNIFTSSDHRSSLSTCHLYVNQVKLRDLKHYPEYSA